MHTTTKPRRPWGRRHQTVTHTPAVAREDMTTAYAWGLTLTQWEQLSDFERAECRRTITTAPRFSDAV